MSIAGPFHAEELKERLESAFEVKEFRVEVYDKTVIAVDVALDYIKKSTDSDRARIHLLNAVGYLNAALSLIPISLRDAVGAPLNPSEYNSDSELRIATINLARKMLHFARIGNARDGATRRWWPPIPLTALAVIWTVAIPFYSPVRDGIFDAFSRNPGLEMAVYLLSFLMGGHLPCDVMLAYGVWQLIRGRKSLALG